MIFILSGGGSEARAFGEALQREGIAHLCVFSTFAEAGLYGRGNAIVGRMTPKSMRNWLRSEAVCGVIDLITSGDEEQSLAAMEACRSVGVPYVKRLHLPHVETAYPKCYVMPSYQSAAEKINQRIGNILLYTSPKAARALAHRVRDREHLYTPILRGVRFDVELAMEFGIPLTNVIERDVLEGVDAVCATAEKIGAGMLVCDGSTPVADKLEAAERLKLPMILTHKMGIEYTDTVLTDEEAIRRVRAWAKKENSEG